MIACLLITLIDIILLTITYPFIFFTLHFVGKDERSFKALYKDLIEHFLKDFLEVLYD